MRFNQTGFSPIIILVILAIISGVILFKNQVNSASSLPSATPALETAVPTSTPTPTPASTPTPKPTPIPTANATSAPTPTAEPVTTNNAPPSSGFSKQSVTSEKGTFTVYIGAADLNTTKVIVDTASSSDCSNDCPVMSLGDYAARNGAYAGINGSFFCPATYDSCAGKTNSFDTLLMNKNKVYFNSANNVYSTVPVAVFSAGSARFIGQSLDWGRDTSVDAVIANYPMLVQGGNIAYAGSGDPKITARGSRCFIGNKGSTVYIGCLTSATSEEAAYTLKALGLENALGLDQGGSTALWWGGYKLGPGRQIPNAVLFVNR